MKIFWFISYVYGGCFPSSQYFYDKQLDEMCLKNIANGILELCEPQNCVIFKQGFIPLRKIVIVYFKNESQPNLENIIPNTFFYYLNSNDINSENYIETINIIVNEILKFHKKCDFDIYFTIDLDNITTDFFNEDILKESIKLMNDVFQKNLKPHFFSKYFPIKYIRCFIERSCSEIFKNIQFLRLSHSERYYCFFFDRKKFDEKLEMIFSRLKTSKISYEKKITDDMIKEYTLEGGEQLDYSVLSILYTMKGTLQDKLCVSQTEFLLKIWEFLKNKTGFQKLFIEIFDKIGYIRKESIVLNLLRSYFEIVVLNPKKNFMYNDLLSFESYKMSDILYFFMNFIELYKDLFDKHTIIFIQDVFKVLVENFKALSRIVLEDKSDNNLEEMSKKYSKYNDLKKENIFFSYTKSIKNIQFNNNIIFNEFMVENRLKKLLMSGFLAKYNNDYIDYISLLAKFDSNVILNYLVYLI